MRATRRIAAGAAICASCFQTTNAIDLDVTSTGPPLSPSTPVSPKLIPSDSIKAASSKIAYGMMSYYTGNHTGDNPGNLPAPYYWWEAGSMFGTMVEYWYYTNDTSYNPTVTEALLSQVGENKDFMPLNQTKTEGNDDQGFWGMAAMSAAEMKYPDPPGGKVQWLALAQAVFNEMVERWDESTCGGGLRWQIFTFNAGYTYKNSIANGCLFNIAARLARYTGNQTYADWADKTWNWMDRVGLIGDKFEVYDGSSDTENCSSVDHIQFSYNQGIFLFGSAVMYEFTNQSSTWQTRLEGLLNSTDIFFKDGIMYESACETVKTTGTCNTDQQSFKAYLSRWMAATAKLVPAYHDTIMKLLKPSAKAAAAQCSGGTDGMTCGEHWYQPYDGLYGLGQQMSALSVVQSMLIDEAPALATNGNGGTSKGDVDAGKKGDASGPVSKPVTTGDRAGAGILTAMVLSGLLGGTSLAERKIAGAGYFVLPYCTCSSNGLTKPQYGNSSSVMCSYVDYVDSSITFTQPIWVERGSKYVVATGTYGEDFKMTDIAHRTMAPSCWYQAGLKTQVQIRHLKYR
ncbi:hypothetical protein VTL71DRAFT_7790 [Oculimacula yallundae]|uniref:mannan endo-1,6-alpha-mannosidase n=1 Tax=Oculimacula yallundae TaxID=86028 RepID=A0ABR4CWP7_9HELO